MHLGKRSTLPLLLVAVCTFMGAVFAQSPDASADTTRDSLVYKDGDRVHGELIAQTDSVIIFKSDRFGELRVPLADAVVIKAEKPKEEAVAKHVEAQGIHTGTTPSERAAQERVRVWDRFSPAVLTAKVRAFFGPWHGRLAFSNELVTDQSHRNNIALDGKLNRKFDRDAVDLTARYDYNETDYAVTMDVFKAGGSWRHDFTKKQFGQYRPTFEWSRVNIKQTAKGEYALLQQEIGYGFNVFNTAARKVRLGVSENLFDTWTPDNRAHSSRAVASLFDEIELALPWRMTLTQRGVWYPESKNASGWEDQLELNKKFTETLSVALRHEIRRNNPDGASYDYTRLKLLLGLDF